MPFKMIANRTVYRADEAKEYNKGETFTVETEKERDRLLRMKRARLDDAKPTGIKSMKRPAEPSQVVQKVETPEPAAVDTSFDPAPTTSRYRRRDLRSED